MMTTNDQISALDCRAVVEKYLGKPKARSAKAWMYKCPFHQDRSPSMVVYQDGWKCFGCNAHGNAVGFVMRFLALDFSLACAELGIGSQRPRQPRPIVRRPEPPVNEANPPDQRWQWFASQVVEVGEKLLWEPEGAEALGYLKRRGFSEFTIRQARLGYIPPKSGDELKYGRIWDKDWTLDDKPVRVHPGILIPHYAQTNLWAVRVRRSPKWGDGPKYMGIRGGSKALYWSDHVEAHLPILITEGEFDALAAWQAAGPGCMVECCPVALASASNHNLSPRWLASLIVAPDILVRMDSDAGGDCAAAALAELGSRMRPVNVPIGLKDVNELLQSGGNRAVQDWVKGLLQCQ